MSEVWSSAFTCYQMSRVEPPLSFVSGEAPPSYLEPTPLQQPRRRPNNLMLPPRPPQPQEDIQPPLTALQRLTLSRRQGSPAPPAASPSVREKPMSKLALLAQKRREAAAAAAASETVQSESVLPQTASRPSAPGMPPNSGAQSPSQPEKKPLSKLAQKMAAARAAREEAAAAAKASKVEKNVSEVQMEVDESSPSVPFPEDPISSLFSSPATLSKPKLEPARPSPFFSIITSNSSQGEGPAKDHLPPEPISASLHAPLITDVDALVKQFEQAFTESPDEIVLRKRQGRAGTADMVTAVKKQATGTGIKPKVK